jgi:hypothetical protein
VEDPAIALIQADLEAEAFEAGRRGGQWRVVAFAYPRLDFKVAAIKPDGTATEYEFRADLTNYPAIGPEVKLWDLENDRQPVGTERPQGGERIAQTFKVWDKATVYRPWDRQTGAHNNNAATKPHLAWNASRDLTFIFEDLHGILVSNARTVAARAAA